MSSNPATYDTPKAIECGSFERARQYVMDCMNGKAGTGEFSSSDGSFAFRCRAASDAFIAAEICAKAVAGLDKLGIGEQAMKSLINTLIAQTGAQIKNFEDGL